MKFSIQLHLFLLMLSILAFSSESTRFEGKLKAGETYERSLGRGLVFKLAPSKEIGAVGDWEVDICDNQSRCGLALVANLPFRMGAKVFEIYGWHFRNADNTGSNDGSTNAPGTERKIAFVTNIRDYAIAKKAFDCGQMSSGVPCENSDQALSNWEKLKKGVINIKLRNMKLTRLEKGQQAKVQAFGFSAEIQWP